jgi:hypothetical protein
MTFNIDPAFPVCVPAANQEDGDTIYVGVSRRLLVAMHAPIHWGDGDAVEQAFDWAEAMMLEDARRYEGRLAEHEV